MLASANRFVGAGVLILAGLYQWTRSRGHASPMPLALHFVQQHGGFQSSPTGSLRLGMLHGAYCVGCCWALMVLLFVGGVMNVLWIAVIAILVLLEKVVPADVFSQPPQAGSRLLSESGCS